MSKFSAIQQQLEQAGGRKATIAPVKALASGSCRKRGRSDDLQGSQPRRKDPHRGLPAPGL